MTLNIDSQSELLEDLGVTSPSDKVSLTASQLLRLLREEREACARIADSMNSSAISLAIKNRWSRK